jgi:hypothetical protein
MGVELSSNFDLFGQVSFAHCWENQQFCRFFLLNKSHKVEIRINEVSIDRQSFVVHGQVVLVFQDEQDVEDEENGEQDYWRLEGEEVD